MNEYINIEVVRQQVERAWRLAEQRARLFAEESHYTADPETVASRAAGGRA